MRSILSRTIHSVRIARFRTDVIGQVKVISAVPQQFSCIVCFGDSLVAQVDIRPPGKAVFHIPCAFAMPEQYDFVHVVPPWKFCVTSAYQRDIAHYERSVERSILPARDMSLKIPPGHQQRDENDLHGNTRKPRDGACPDIDNRRNVQANDWPQQCGGKAECNSARDHGEKERPNRRNSPGAMSDPRDQAIHRKLDDHGWQDGDRRHACHERAQQRGGNTEEGPGGRSQQQPPKQHGIMRWKKGLAPAAPSSE